MKFGIEWDRDRAISIEARARLMKENGFDATFIGLEEENLEEILACLKKYEIVCESCHAPFNGINNMWIAGEDGEKMLERLCNCVDACARNEIPTLVVHLSSGWCPPRMNDVGFERYDCLMRHADAAGVKIAYENIRRLDNVAYALENYPQAGVCWDVGHEACYMNGKEFMPLFGDRMIAIHIHDNSALRDEDLHLLPYDGAINMDRAAEHFARSGYQGAIMLEVTQKTARMASAEEFYAKAHDVALRFAARVEAFHKEL